MLGGSTGINVAGAIRLAKQLGPGHTLVTILCDSGNRYQNKTVQSGFHALEEPTGAGWLEKRSKIEVPFEWRVANGEWNGIFIRHSPLQRRIWLRNSFVRSCCGLARSSGRVRLDDLPRVHDTMRLATSRANPISWVTTSMVMPSLAR